METNGYVEAEDLSNPLFDRLRPFFKLFDSAHRKKMMDVPAFIKGNAEKPAAKAS